jgi:DNA-binding MarR family transcriptional regulator
VPEVAAAGGTNVLFDVWLVSRSTSGLLDAALGPSGLTADEFGIYSVLSSGDGSTPTELARWMSAPATTVSSYAKRLEQRGHLTRVRNPDDGRSHLLRLTPAGRRAHQAAGVAFLPVLQQVLDRLGPRTAGIRESLAALQGALDDVRDAAPAASP